MSTDLQIFDFEDNAVRTMFGETGEILFHGTDVCKCLGYVNTRQAIQHHLSDDDVYKLDVIDKMGRTQTANFINEAGLYSLIFGSTKAEAVRFKYWVTHDVLPQIRKTGIYRSDGVTKCDTVLDDHPDAVTLDPDIVTHLSLVREARMTWGKEAARELWLKLPLPVPRDVPQTIDENLVEGAGVVRSFLDIVRDETFAGRVQATRLYQAYCDYVRQREDTPISQRIFGHIATQVLKRQRFGGYYYYTGCRLLN